GLPERAIELSERAIKLGTTLGLDYAVYRALGYRGAARCDSGDPGGIDDLRRALAMAVERGDTFYAATSYVNLGDVVWANEGPEEGLKNHREGVDYCARRGAVQMAMWARAETTWMLFDNGEWDELIG